jgi:hypothetical protein
MSRPSIFCGVVRSTGPSRAVDEALPLAVNGANRRSQPDGRTRGVRAEALLRLILVAEDGSTVAWPHGHTPAGLCSIWIWA